MKNRPGYLIILVLLAMAVTLSCGPQTLTLSPQSPKISKTSTLDPTREIDFTETSPGVDQVTIDKLAKTEEVLSKIKVQTSTPIVEEFDGIEIAYVYSRELITALYHLYGTDALDSIVDITLTNHDPKTVTLIVETSIEGYTTKAMDTVHLESGATVELHQNPRLTAEALDKLNSEKPGNFLIKVTKTNPEPASVLLDESTEIRLRSRRDFVFIDGVPFNEEYDYLAAWVTPTDPKVEKLIRSAANYTKNGITESGYKKDQLNDKDGSVWDRLQAVWQAEAKDYNLTYVSTMVAFGPNTIQRIRLPSEVLDQASGNCMETSILFAAAAEAMSLESNLIRIPGHMYVGVRMDQTNANYYFIETTLIGRSSFADAVKSGEKEWNDALPHFQAKEEGYRWITVQDAWGKGIMPIPWN